MLWQRKCLSNQSKTHTQSVIQLQDDLFRSQCLSPLSVSFSNKEWYQDGWYEYASQVLIQDFSKNKERKEMKRKEKKKRKEKPAIQFL